MKHNTKCSQYEASHKFCVMLEGCMQPIVSLPFKSFKQKQALPSPGPWFLCGCAFCKNNNLNINNSTNRSLNNVEEMSL